MTEFVDFREAASKPLGPPPPKRTRRAERILCLLAAGYVAEQRVTGRPASRSYLLRGPSNFEADGERVNAKVIDALLGRGEAVRLRIPTLGKTWVIGLDHYERNRDGFTVLESTPSKYDTTPVTSTPTPTGGTRP